MFAHSLRAFFNNASQTLARSQRQQRQPKARSFQQRAASSSAPIPAPQQTAGTWGAAALTSGTLSALGDALAQYLVNRTLMGEGKPPRAYEAERTLRMFGFGLLFYGPYQKWWYGMLARQFPGASLRSFLAKVTLNQIALSPVVLAVVFSWNLALCGQAAGIPDKLRADLVPTMINGWKFWVPAAGINFYAVPLPYQVLYMSTCGVLWTAYISFASYNSANAIKASPAGK